MTTAAKRRAGKKIAPRFVEYTANGGGDFDGWYIRMRADFPTRVIVELQSENVDRIVTALSGITVEHNMPDDSGAVAEDLADVDYNGLLHMLGGAMDAIQRLPPR